MEKSRDDALASEGLSFGFTTPGMSKLNQKELLRMLSMAVQNAIEYFVIGEDKEFMAKIPKLQQAHLQIKEIIQKYFQYTEEVKKSMTALKKMRKNRRK